MQSPVWLLGLAVLGPLATQWDTVSEPGSGMAAGRAGSMAICRMQPALPAAVGLGRREGFGGCFFRLSSFNFEM